MTAWKPLGDLDELLDLDGLARLCERAVPLVLRYTDWAVRALAELTAVACELSDSMLAEMERHRTADLGRSSNALIVMCQAEDTISTYPDLARKTRGNLAKLRELGYVPWGAGLATVAQGVKHPDFVHRLTPLAQDWCDAGLPFPSAPFVIWDKHVPLLGGAS